MGPPKFKLLNFLNKAQKFLKLTKDKGKIKFEKTWRYQNGVPKCGSQNSNFLTTLARHMKFSG